MKEMIKKLYPIVLPPVCLIAGIVALIFFFFGPFGKGAYDILAIGVILIVLAIFQIVMIIITLVKEKRNKK